MNTRSLVSLALLVGVGAVLSMVIPGIVFGMKPDMMLTMMFLGIILFRDVKYVVILGVVTGIISGLTSSFPSGLFPNIIDKVVTSFVFFGLLFITSKLSKKLPTLIILTAIGTIVSGTVFLGSASLLVGLPGSFTVLFGTIVLPAAVLNAVAMFILYPIITSILKRTNMAHSL
ncbi:tryptophan transporter [Heyndrickxia ginsengihumi]|uniref:Tryptophan transporter n=1 Tax=Heyndrickxia ginsengihumi TaxID=363870 RepID=A0A6M0P378_9BACI|nr:tryptophan transporter [Heyndrickxia ginsengihumi]MBE6185635.1 tryptophan transporter [Bacillus sp. (in: firmicutes)]NEY18887.1 tryptophan transporter [Heyndrickxia ginsengihumi]